MIDLPRTYIQTGCLAFVLSALAMPVAIFVLRRCGIVDPTAHNKIHKKPVARGGGIAIFGAFAVAVLQTLDYSYPLQGVMIGAFICLVVGAADDCFGGIPALWKLLALCVATFILSEYGVRLNLFKSYPLDMTFTLLWVVGVTSAFNGIDNMDGLAAGIAAIVSAMYLTIAVQAFQVARAGTNLWWFGILASALIGANLGFLLYNFKPARVFMGDSGSLFLGFTLSALGVMGEWTESRVISCTIPVLILGVPIFDFAYILVARVLRGETRTLRAVIEHCGTDHVSHRLVWIGFTERKAVLFIYLIALALGVSGVLLRNSTSLVDSLLALFQGLSIALIVMVLMATAKRIHNHVQAPAPLPHPVPREEPAPAAENVVAARQESSR